MPDSIASFLFMLGLMAALSVMDALARRARAARGEGEPEAADEAEPDREEDAVPRETPSRGPRPPRLPVPVGEGRPRSPMPVAGRPRPPVRVGQAEGPRRPVPTPRPEAEPMTTRDDLAPPESEPAEAPPLVAAAEEIRERGRRRLRALTAAPPIPAPAPEDLVTAKASRGKPGPERLEDIVRGGPRALRAAVLYREILGAPLGSRPRPGGWEEPD